MVVLIKVLINFPFIEFKIWFTVINYNILYISSFLSCYKQKWLRYYATNRKVAGSIPDEVNF
jgi:hypothetical protein